MSKSTLYRWKKAKNMEEVETPINNVASDLCNEGNDNNKDDDENAEAANIIFLFLNYIQDTFLYIPDFRCLNFEISIHFIPKFTPREGKKRGNLRKKNHAIFFS